MSKPGFKPRHSGSQMCIIATILNSYVTDGFSQWQRPRNGVWDAVKYGLCVTENVHSPEMSAVDTGQETREMAPLHQCASRCCQTGKNMIAEKSGSRVDAVLAPLTSPYLISDNWHTAPTPYTWSLLKGDSNIQPHWGNGFAPKHITGHRITQCADVFWPQGTKLRVHENYFENEQEVPLTSQILSKNRKTKKHMLFFIFCIFRCTGCILFCFFVVVVYSLIQCILTAVAPPFPAPSSPTPVLLPPHPLLLFPFRVLLFLKSLYSKNKGHLVYVLIYLRTCHKPGNKPGPFHWKLCHTEELLRVMSQMDLGSGSSSSSGHRLYGGFWINSSPYMSSYAQDMKTEPLLEPCAQRVFEKCSLFSCPLQCCRLFQALSASMGVCHEPPHWRMNAKGIQDFSLHLPLGPSSSLFWFSSK